jgi:transcriptional regulator with XRE-family HTH domain
VIQKKETKAAKDYDPVDVHVGQRIRAYRISKGMSQTTLGEKIGVTFQQIQKYERAANRVGSGRLKKVATALGVPVAALFGEESSAADETADQLIPEILSQPYAARLLRAFNSITDREQRLALLQMAESIARNTR